MAHKLGRIVSSLMLVALGASGGEGRANLGTDHARSAGPGSPPLNIVVLMADDLDVVSFETAIRTGLLPHLTQLFSSGTRFGESFVSESLCCPSRATYLTGLYPHNHGVVGNSGPRGGFDAFMQTFADNNLATWMQAAGYHTAHVGKYLNGYADGRLVPPGWDEWQGLVDPTTYCMYDYDVSNNGAPVHHGHDLVKDYQTDVLAGLAEEFILGSRAQGDARPLFLSVAPLAPHRESRCFDGVRPAPRHYGTPRLVLPNPPSFNEADMGDKPGWMQRLPLVKRKDMVRLYNQRIAALRAVDDLLGRIVHSLETVQELDRTAFVFTSDNGYLLGRHRWESKILLYEESIRVPLLLRIPGLTGPPSVTDMALNNDLAPTIADLAGAAPGLVMDGRSLLPLLEGTATSWRKRFQAAFPPQVPGRLGADPDLAGVAPRIPPFFAVRSGSDGDLSNLVYGETMSTDGSVVRARELYDLRPHIDPFQIASRHHDPAYASTAWRLKLHLEALKSCGEGTCQEREE